MPRATKNVARVVVLGEAVDMRRHTMIVSTVLALGAVTARKVNAEPVAGGALLLLLRGLRVARVSLGVKPVNGWQPLVPVLPIRQVLVVPNVVVIVALNIRRVPLA